MQTANQNCKNCGNLLTGRYCSNCGERLYSNKDKSVSHILKKGFHFVTRFEGSFLFTLKTIFTKPGEFSADYCNGIRKKYSGPISFFLLGIVIYLFFPFFGGLNMSFNNNLDNFDFVKAETMAIEKAEAENITIAELGRRYDSKSPTIAKLLLLVLLPITGLLLQAMFWKKRKKYFEHFILGTEISSFYVYFTFILLPLFLYLLYYILQLFNVDGKLILDDPVSIPLYMCALVFTCLFAFKRFYDIPLLIAFSKALLFLLFHSIIIYFIYRLILFFIVLLFI